MQWEEQIAGKSDCFGKWAIGDHRQVLENHSGD